MPESVSGLLAEMTAQGAAERVMDGEGSITDALHAIERALSTSEPSRVNRLAMQCILGSVPPSLETVQPDESDEEVFLFDTVALTWVGWLTQSEDRKRLKRYGVRLRKGPKGSTGAVTRMALQLWMDAVERLLEGDRTEAQRLWCRALEVGSSFGIEAHPTILWTYLATFWPQNGRSPQS